MNFHKPNLRLVLAMPRIVAIFFVAAFFIGAAVFQYAMVQAENTAHIENAGDVTPSNIDFGTVFTQERISKDLNIVLSDSFIASNQVDGINYSIIQKPTCKSFNSDGSCAEYYPNLCPYLSKLPEPNTGDTGVNAPHETQPYPVATGNLSKSANNTSDHWNVQLGVPCFEGECPQNYNPAEFGTPLPLELKGQTFNCELWVTVTGIESNSVAKVFDKYLPVKIAKAFEAHIINVTATVGESQNACGSTTSFTDVDGNIYDTVSIGTQCWAKQNLRTGVRIDGTVNSTQNGIIEKYCYDNNDANCLTDGGLYQWDEAMNYSTVEGAEGICPSGWHIPRDSEWYTLENYLKDDTNSCVSTRTGWDCDAAGTKLGIGGSSGFEAIFAGARNNSTDGSFSTRGMAAFFWSSTEGGVDVYPWIRLMFSGYTSVYRYATPKNPGWSVRCLKNQQVNSAPIITSLKQFKSDGVTEIPEGGEASESTVILNATFYDPDIDPVKIQIEIRKFNEPFTGIDDGSIIDYDYAAHVGEITIPIGLNGLTDGAWHWRIKVIDDKENTSGWQEFGQAGNTDFIVQTNISPVAKFSFSPKNPKKNETINFNASESFDPDGSIKQYNWDFGDGVTVSENGQITAHSFAEAKSYTVKLTVIDDKGASNSLTRDLQVFTHRVAYIPVRYEGDPAPFHSISELQQRVKQVNEYYNQQSYGVVNIGSEFIFGEWQSLGKKLEDYPVSPESKFWYKRWELIRDDAINLSGLNLDNYDSVVVIQPACMRSFTNDIKGKKIITQDRTSFGVYSHELGHALFGFYDYYYVFLDELLNVYHTQGNTHYWDLMGAGTEMNPTSSIMSFNKVKAGWLRFNQIKSEEYGEYPKKYPLNLLMDLKQGDDIYTYKTSSGNTDYYIFEGRRPPDGIASDTLVPPKNQFGLLQGYCVLDFDYNLSEDEGILLYKVTNEQKVYTVPHPVPILPDAQETVTLTPGDSYIDEEAEVKFTAKKEADGWKIEIAKSTPFLKSVVSSLFKISILSKEPIVPNPLQTNEVPDVDLRVYSYDGKMVGMDYNSLTYENQIGGAVTSGNIPGGGPEWISIPKNTKIYYTVDATPLRKWAEETNTPIEDVSAVWRIIDYDDKGNRKESEPIETRININEPTTLAIEADVYVEPDTLNLKSEGGEITAYIELPNGYDINKIDRSTILLNYEVSMENNKKYGFTKDSNYEIADRDNDGLPELMVKFDRKKVIEMINGKASGKKEFEFNIIGQVVSGQIPILFKGTDNVKIVSEN